MATANPYLDGPHYPTHPAANPQSGSRTSKRKRDPNDHRVADSPGMNRGMPNQRRTSSHQHAPGDPNNAFEDPGMHNPNAGPHFDLSALQSHHAQAQAHNVPHHSSGPASMNSTAAAALSYTMTVPPHPAQDFMHQPTVGGDNNLAVSDFQNIGSPPTPSRAVPTPPHSANHHPHASANTPPSDSARDGGASSSHKPQPGTEGWNKLRKDNHKEVERRRRETINEGINELAKIVPGCEKNKGSILARAVQYIQKLQDDASSNIDKWTFEKLVTEQAIGDLSGKLSRAHATVAALKREAAVAGVDVEALEMGLGAEMEAAEEQQHREQQQAQQQQQQQPSSSNSGGNGGNGNGNGGASAAATAAAAQRAQAAGAQQRPLQPQPPRVGTANMGQGPGGQDEAGGIAQGADSKTG